MSFSELFVVIIIGLIVLRPQDLPLLAKSIKNLYKSFLSIREQAEKEFFDITEDISIDDKDKETINFYLKKIAEMGSSYEGAYNISEVKSYYQKLLRNEGSKKK